MDPLARIDRSKLNVEFLGMLLGLFGAISAHGQSFVATYGYRSLELQKELHDKYLAGGPRAAPPGKSAHNYGAAVDLCRLVDGKPDWQSGDYALLADLAPRYRLTTGAPYKDYGHVELEDWHKLMAVSIT
jgi:LAS superfamily LD-carboxypeptidase LdcB